MPTIASGTVQNGVTDSTINNNYTVYGSAVNFVLNPPNGTNSMTVSSGGLVSGGTIANGSVLTVVSGGSALGVLIANSATGYFDSAYVGGVVIANTATAYFVSAYASGVVIENSPVVYISGGSFLSYTFHNGTVSATSSAYLSGGTEQANATLNLVSGAVETALSDGGGNIIVGNGGTASATTISNGGVETVSSGGTSLRDVISAGGTAIISSGGFAGGDTIDGGAFIIVTSATISNGITFGPVTGGVLSLSAPPLMASATLLGGQAITGFTSSGDTIAISGYALSTGAKMTEVSSGVAVLSNGAESFTLDIAGIPLGDTFKLAAGTGSIIDITGFSCFLAGTGIMTPSGLRRVEDLGKGDLVLTAAGEAKPIRWIGHRHVTIADRTDADLHAPICFLRDAIADGKPARDLWVTPDHAILVRDKLIPAKLLVNGSTIRKVPRAEYRFYHIELERHDLLLAEGLEAESYLDVVDSRRRFDNNPFTSLRHDLSLTALTEQAYAARGCHPITLNPEAVRPVWQALADRAEARFAQNTTRWTPEPDLRLRVAGKELQPAISENGTYVFILPGDAGEATILSRAASPWQRRPWIDDRRQLGVAIREITCATAHGTQKLPLDSSGLMAGWHGVEGAQGEAYRWTNGAAGLPLPPDTNCVVLKLVGSAEYPLEPAEGDAPDLQLTEPRLMPDRPIARAG